MRSGGKVLKQREMWTWVRRLTTCSSCRWRWQWGRCSRSAGDTHSRRISVTPTKVVLLATTFLLDPDHLAAIQYFFFFYSQCKLDILETGIFLIEVIIWSDSASLWMKSRDSTLHCTIDEVFWLDFRLLIGQSIFTTLSWVFYVFFVVVVVVSLPAARPAERSPSCCSSWPCRSLSWRTGLGPWY